MSPVEIEYLNIMTSGRQRLHLRGQASVDETWRSTTVALQSLIHFPDLKVVIK